MTTSNIEKKTWQAPDISCGHCVASIQNRLGEMDGVSFVQASAETKQVDVEFDPSVVTADSLIEALADEGYPIKQ